MESINTNAELTNPKNEPSFLTWYLLNLSKLFFVLGSFYLFLKRSWVGEDAFIFFRYVDNFVNGDGLVFNLGERVEGYTAPLWVFVLSVVRYLTHWELRPTAIILGLILSTFIVSLLVYKDKTKKIFFPLTLIFLVTNSAFRDFATSGFETSLTYVLLIILLILIFENKHFLNPILVSTIASLLVLNRPEAFLILVYIGIVVLLNSYKTKNYKLLISFIFPVILILVGYQIFRMGYFASLLPNTFYAKKGGTIYIAQGFNYLKDFALSYPFTVILYLILTSVTLLKQNIFKQAKNLLIITVLLISYVLYAGGDYMHGRSLLMAFISWTLALIPSVNYLVEFSINKYKLSFDSSFYIFTIISVILIFVGLKQVSYTARDAVQRNNINDERRHFGVYFAPEDFISYIKEPITGEFGWRDRGFYYKELSEKLDLPISVVNWNIGYFGYAGGKDVSVLGGVLIDPYLARLDVQKRGKIGHENGPEWQYILSLKPTFSYTPFKYWNDSAHFKWEGAKYASVIKDDSNDSFVPVFDLSNEKFINEYSNLIGKDIKNQIDLAQIQFLADVAPDNLNTWGFDVNEYMGFLKTYWYPYASTPAQDLFKAAAINIKWTEGITQYENFYKSEHEQASQIWDRVKSPMSAKNFMINISYSLKNR